MASSSLSKKLLIFDINGVLCHHCKDTNNYSKHKDNIKYYRTRNHCLIQRPNVLELFNTLSQEFDLAIWTSANPTNADAIVKTIFDKKNQL